MSRATVISQLADRIAGLRFRHPARVGIDGVDASGKTRLADELAAALRHYGRHVIRVSIDGFHNPRAIRYRQGRESARGYYEDSFDHDAILSCVLVPLGEGGALKYKAAQFDFQTESKLDAPWQRAQADSILLFDGVFLQCPALREHWDFTIFVDARFEVTLRRACKRDLYLFGEAERIKDIYQNRYIPGQRIYLELERPRERADLVIDNNNIRKPRLVE